VRERARIPSTVPVFSHRVPDELAPNRIAAARAKAPPQFDLTVSNPTACGLAYPGELLTALGAAEGLAYRPEPRGQVAARRAVAHQYERYGLLVDPARIVLTASTSEAYAFLFKLLADPGDRVLVPTPSYPLFEHLARVEGVRALPYALDPEAGWRLDLPALADVEGARAVVVVHPNNPTGTYVHPDDAGALAELAARKRWAIIADEVFLDYPLDGGPGAGRSFAAAPAALTFALGGLSKSAGLPQLKLAWIVVSGPDDEATAALERLDVIADTFLSVATPVQNALPALLREGAAVGEAILGRCRGNLDALRRAASTLPSVDVAPSGGGWSAVLRVPAVVDEEDLVVELLREDSVGVHPGYFFDFPAPGYLVLSLLLQPERFEEGVARLLRRVAAHLVQG
jgi:alanine-synthesizing transaminase